MFVTIRRAENYPEGKTEALVPRSPSFKFSIPLGHPSQTY